MASHLLGCGKQRQATTLNAQRIMAATNNNLLKNNQASAYFLLTFIISWGAILSITGPNGLPAASEEAKQAIGSGLLLGPSMAAVILTAVLEGRVGLRELIMPRNSNTNYINLSQIGGSGHYATAILLAPLSSVATLLMLSTFVNEAYTPKLFISTDKSSLVLSGISVGLVIATFEEVGWSGFAVPQLLQTHTVFQTGVITGFFWGLWHFPLFWEVDTFSSRMSVLLLFGRLCTWIIAFRCIMVWLYSRMKRSLAFMMMILMHTSLVFCMIAIEPALQDSELLKYIFSWTLLLWFAIWFGVRWIYCTHEKGQ